MSNKQRALTNIIGIVSGVAALFLYYTATKPMPSIVAYLGWFGFITSTICLIFNLKGNGK
jgi:hypothetical protein